MNILIAPNSFKGSLSCVRAAEQIEKGFKFVSKDFKTIKFPVADGGDDTLSVIIKSKNGKCYITKALNPLGSTVTSSFGIINEKTAIIELALISGLNLLKPDEYDPLNSTTFGTGQLIKAALDIGCDNFIIGIGGSATIDAGVGMMQALGIKFTDKNGEEVKFGGAKLCEIEHINTAYLDKRLLNCKISVACDVNNTLLGKRGAANVFAPQKGATPEQVKILDRNLAHYAKKLKEFIGKDIGNIEFGGAAGGTGISLYSFLNAELKNGIDLILDITNFSEHLLSANLVITAEGKIDDQTFEGKGPLGVAKKAREAGKPIIALAGQVNYKSTDMFDAAFSIINRPMDLQTAVDEAGNLLYHSAVELARLLLKL